MRVTLPLVAASLLPVAIMAGLALAQPQTVTSPPAPTSPPPITTAQQLLTGPLPTVDAGRLERGRALVIAGDCLACHTRPGGVPMAGGLGMQTPFGVIYTPNLTSDRATGIGAWTPDQFYRAMHEGRGLGGRYLYPAFPYPYYTYVTRADDDAMLEYLKTVPPVSYTPPANRLPFPLNIRFVMWGWNLLFFRPHTFQPDPARSVEWNHGAYLVTALGHCGGCHTPTNFLGASKNSKNLQGGFLLNWVAPDLTSNPRTGLGRWSPIEIAEFLKTGRNGHAQASGPMADVISDSTSLMSDGDLLAIVTYLKSQPASPSPSVRPPDPAAMRRGAAIYSDACASCHLERAVGQPRYFPPLGSNASLQQANPDGVLNMILGGTRTAPTLTHPSPLSMPSFAWKLTDQETADVTTYLRNSWGNRASPVSAGQVANMRRKLNLKSSTLTVNSGDHAVVTGNPYAHPPYAHQ